MKRYRYAFVLITVIAMLFALNACAPNELIRGNEVVRSDVTTHNTRNGETGRRGAFTRRDETFRNGEITLDGLVGVWRTEGFAEHAGDFWAYESFAAMYVTDDGNIFIHVTLGSTAGPLTTTYHSQYEFMGSELVLISTHLDGHFGDTSYLKDIQITAERNGIRVETITGPSCTCYACINRDPVQRTHIFYKYSNELPYGWTFVQKNEINETNARIIEEIFAFADRFSQELGIPVEPYDVNEWRTAERFLYQHHLPFIIEDTVIEIAFTGEPLLPTRPQRHVHVHEPSFLMVFGQEERSAEGQFVFVYDGIIRDLPEEWIEVFRQVDDSVAW